MRVLSIVHEAGPTGGGGIFERAVTERGDRLDRWVAADGEAPPGAPSDWDAVMVFGGAMHPDQDAEHPWLADEDGFLETALADGVPLLGVCLGAQLIARGAGRLGRPLARRPRSAGSRSARRRAGRSCRRLAARAVPRLPVALLHVRPPGRRRAARRERRGTAGVPARRPRLGDPVPRRGRPPRCSTTGSARDGRSCPSPSRSCGPRPTATCRPGTSREGRSAARSSTRRRASARIGALCGARLGRQCRVARPFVPRALVVPRTEADRGEELHRGGGAAAGMAVGDHLGALVRADQLPDGGRARGARAEQLVEADMAGARDPSRPRVARRDRAMPANSSALLTSSRTRPTSPSRSASSAVVTGPVMRRARRPSRSPPPPRGARRTRRARRRSPDTARARRPSSRAGAGSTAGTRRRRGRTARP